LPKAASSPSTSSAIYSPFQSQTLPSPSASDMKLPQTTSVGSCTRSASSILSAAPGAPPPHSSVHSNEDEQVIANWHRNKGRKPQVAVCIVGAWRLWELSWASMKPNLVKALDADIFAVSDQNPGGANPRAHVNTNFTVEKMEKEFGSRLKGAEHITMEELRTLPPYLTFPEIKRGRDKGFFFWVYFFKIWSGTLLALRILPAPMSSM